MLKTAYPQEGEKDGENDFLEITWTPIAKVKPLCVVFLSLLSPIRSRCYYALFNVSKLLLITSVNCILISSSLEANKILINPVDGLSCALTSWFFGKFLWAVQSLWSVLWSHLSAIINKDPVTYDWLTSCWETGRPFMIKSPRTWTRGFSAVPCEEGWRAFQHAALWVLPELSLPLHLQAGGKVKPVLILPSASSPLQRSGRKAWVLFGPQA